MSEKSAHRREGIAWIVLAIVLIVAIIGLFYLYAGPAGQASLAARSTGTGIQRYPAAPPTSPGDFSRPGGGQFIPQKPVSSSR